MKIKTAWAIQSFFLCFLFNMVFAAVICFMADRILEAFNEWVSPLTGPGAPALPEDLQMALGSFGNFVVQVRGYLLAVIAALASAFTLLLWFFLFLTGGRQIRKAGERTGLSRTPEPELSQAITDGADQGK
ncbi:MAG: hypothetical protein ABSF90_16465 [Syntrophobacteraceae bacterium]|jgi:hypothetical protein